MAEYYGEEHFFSFTRQITGEIPQIHFLPGKLHYEAKDGNFYWQENPNIITQRGSIFSIHFSE